MKTTIGVIVAASLGVGAWALYKKYNPRCAEDIRESLCNMNKKSDKN